MGKSRGAVMAGSRRWAEGAEQAESKTKQTCDLAQLVGQLVAACDHYAACYVQENLLREDVCHQLEQVRGELEAQRQEISGRQFGDTGETTAQAGRETKQGNCGEAELIPHLEQLQYLVSLGDALTDQLERKEKECARLRVQNAYLQAQNQRYQRLFHRLSETWYGKILKRLYHFMQKFGWV